MQTQASITAFLRLRCRPRSCSRADADWRLKSLHRATNKLAVRQPVADHSSKITNAAIIAHERMIAAFDTHNQPTVFLVLTRLLARASTDDLRCVQINQFYS